MANEQDTTAAVNDKQDSTETTSATDQLLGLVEHHTTETQEMKMADGITHAAAQTPASDLAEEILAQENKKREALRVLLDEQLATAGKLPVLTTKMSDTESYLGSVTLRWLAGTLGFAKDLPLFKHKLTQHGELVIDERTIDDIVQRPLDWTRQLPLTIYLAGRRYHKFPVILAVMTDKWVDDPQAEEWERNGDDQSKWTAKRSVIEYEKLDSSGKFGLISLGGYLFALDGQHRFMGILGLIDLIRQRRISKKNKQGIAAKTTYTLDDLAETYHFDPDGIDSLGLERIGIEIIPAVKKGETREEARLRVTSVFTHVNKHATVLTPGQVAQLDPDDGFSIVARWAAVEHPLLKMTPGRADNPRVNWNNSNIANRSTVLTTLQTLTEMAKNYLGHRPPFDSWADTELKDLVPVRPDDDELGIAYDELTAFLTELSKLPSIEDLDRGVSTRDFRLFTHEVVKAGPPEVFGKAHLLFRPVGQIVLADAVGALVAQGKSLEDIFKMLKDYEKLGGFTIDDSANPWWGVLYEPAGNKMARGGEALAADVLIYLLGGMTDPTKREELRTDLAGARTIRDGSRDEDKPYGFDGKRVNLDDFKLPKML